MLQQTPVIKFAFASLVAIGLSLATQQAKAAQISYSGSNCTPTNASVGFVDYNAYGVMSLGDPATFQSAQVSCPLPVPYTAGGVPGNLTSVTVAFFDRNDGFFQPNKDFSCTIYYQNSAGTPFTGATATKNWFSLPTPTTMTVTGHSNVVGATMICDLPAPEGGNLSHLLNYLVTTS